MPDLYPTPTPICWPCRNGEHENCDWDEACPPARCTCPCPSTDECCNGTDTGLGGIGYCPNPACPAKAGDPR